MKMPNMIVTTLAAIAIITVLGFLARDDGRIRQWRDWPRSWRADRA